MCDSQLLLLDAEAKADPVEQDVCSCQFRQQTPYFGIAGPAELPEGKAAGCMIFCSTLLGIHLHSKNEPKGQTRAVKPQRAWLMPASAWLRLEQASSIRVLSCLRLKQDCPCPNAAMYSQRHFIADGAF